VRHARAEDLVVIEPLLAEIRARSELIERSPGTFYRKSQAFLHFHEDPAGLFADVRLAEREGFTRMRVMTKAEQKAFLTAVRLALS
jgi:N-acetylglutamate synthase-like GNAT family acetyltransferase